ncbi:MULTISPECIES: TonB-dependent siderophore receptor [Pseudomonas]|uniref:TonB-dependent siderophore receptor n=1 Tax=Pseudomonas TaxID=286 RepID=UPI001E39038E|nr:MULTISPECIES: TonB-dependent receptor [Pseudomonas]MCQ0166696.1 TonB-dependent siderophore receptor [Pseudomonas sp. S12(2018)]UVL52023.1 TonB-dependent receptor [Pseudomonas sp. B21-036]WKL66594.1 TonB-dependent siderophore receptor [Pseudomonas qingdaonensis]
MQYPRDVAFTRRPLASAILAASLLALLPGAAVQAAEATQAQTQRIDFHISTQSLVDAIELFSAQSGYQVIYDANQVAGIVSPEVQGQYTAEQALRTLTGSSARLSQPNPNSFLIELPVDLGSGLQLDAVSISGKAPGSTTEGTGLYTTYSSSSSTRLNLTPRETPQALTVMTRQRLDDQRLSTLTDTLEATPGIIVTRDGLGAESDSYYSRGFVIQNYEVDGVPTTTRMDNYTQSMAMYDRVEIVRGASGLISGMGSPSATINLIRKRPTYEGQASITGSAGTWDRYGSGFDVSGPLTESGNVRGRLVADYKTEKAWVDRYKQDTQLLYGITEFDLSEDTLLTLGLSYLRTDVDSPLRSGLPTRFSNGERSNLSRSINSAPTWSYNDHEQTSYFASVEQQLGNGWSGKLEYSHSENKFDELFGFVMGDLNPDGSGMSQLPVRFSGTPRQDNLDLYVTGPFSLFEREHELIGGVTLSQFSQSVPEWGGWRYDYNATPGASIDNIFDWDGKQPKPAFTESGKSSQEENQYAAYLTTRLHLSDDLNLILGSRLIDWERKTEDRPYGAASSNTDRKETGVFIPYAGVVYDLNDTWSLYASYTKIFNPQGSWVQDAQFKPIDPMQGIGYEMGIKGSHFDGKLNSSVAVFKLEQDNLAIWQHDNVYEAKQDTTSKGIEMEINGELAEGWQASAGYAYTLTTDNQDERINTVLPRHSLKTFTSYRLPGVLDKVTVGGGVNWQSKVGNDLHTFTQGSYAIANLMARYDINEHLEASVNLNNLFDREYYSMAGLYGTYGAPRNVMTNFTYRF